MTSPSELAKIAQKRQSEQNHRIQRYENFEAAYHGRREGGHVYANYADGRPAMKDLQDMNQRGQGRPSPNLLKPVIDDQVAIAGQLPTITFDPEDESEEAVKQAELASKVCRGMWELSQMSVNQVRAVMFNKMFGEVCYTLDPLRPKEASATNDPFDVPGIYINVVNPKHAYPQFGVGRNFGRIQNLFLVHEMEAEEAEAVYGNNMVIRNNSRVSIITYYDRDYKCTVLSQGDEAVEIFRDDHKYGFVPAEWGINKVTAHQWGMSELDQATELQKTNDLLFNLSLDSIISSVFPVAHFHNAEHTGRLRVGPGAVIETSEDGSFEYIQPAGNTEAATRLLSQSQENLLRQVGTSPIRIDGQIQHSNTSRAALGGAQQPQEQRNAISNVLLGTTLQWLNSKMIRMLATDKGFKNTQLTVYGTDSAGSRSKTTFKGTDLGDVWRNRVQWTSLLGGNKHEDLVMSLQLQKEGIYSKKKVLESIGDPDPEGTLKAAQADQQAQMAQMQQAQQAQQPPQGGPPPGGGSPTEKADQGVGMMAGALPQGAQEPAPPQGGGAPAQPGPQMPGFPAQATAPGSPSGGASPVPDIWSMVQQEITKVRPELLNHIVNCVGLPNGIYVQVDDQKYIPILRTILNPVAKMVGGSNGQLVVSIKPPSTTKGN